MRIRYKETYIQLNGFSIGVHYDETKDEKNKFYFYYLTEDGSNANITSKVINLTFKVAMDFKTTPGKMKDTMEDLKLKFEEFNELGGGNIIEFLSYLKSYERDEKLNQLGI